MRHIIPSILLLILLVCTAQIYAADDRQPKTVSGKVRYEDLSVAKNVLVSIRCKNTTLTDETSINGNYSVIFPDFTCEQFDTVVVLIDTATHSGTGSREVTFALGQALPDIILSEKGTVTPKPEEELPVSVPEFGTLSAIMAGGASIVTYARLRRYNK